MSGLDFNDNVSIVPEGHPYAGKTHAAAWVEFMNQLTYEELCALFANGGYRTPGLGSIGKKQTGDQDGPAQLKFGSNGGKYNVSSTIPNVAGTAWCCETNIASTWDVELAAKQGLCVGNESLFMGTSGWYGPAMNTHRSAFAGRNFEYYSQDGVHGGFIAAAVVKAAQSKGCNVYLKHFAMNDQETDRTGMGTFNSEQAMREIYLKPFEEAIKRGEAVALMSSFNRIGAIWTGGSQALCQGVLRNEWGFKGMTITDYTENGTLQDTNQMLRAGGNFVLSSSNYNKTNLSNATPRLQWRVRESAKQVVYGSIRPLHVNAVYNSDASHKAITATSGKSPWVWWKPLLHGVEAFVIVGFAFGTVAALFPSNPEFRAHLFGKKKETPDSGEKVE